MKKYLLFSIVTAFSFAAQAADLSYNYVGVGYSEGKLEKKVDYDGADINASFAINESFFVLASYQALETDESGSSIEVDQGEFGVGYHSPLSDTVDLVATLAYQNVDIEVAGPGFGGSSDFDGYGIGFGLRWLVCNNFELNAGVEYRDVEEAIDSEVGYEVGARYLMEDFSIGVGYSAIDIIEDEDLSMEAVRIDFRFDF